MAETTFRDGKAPFHDVSHNNLACETYYKIYGDLHGGATPLVVLHGGPGAGHEGVEPFSALWRRRGIPVVFYDQIGCGASTHLPEMKGDMSFWQPDLFVAELENLLKYLHISEPEGPGFDILGHSWGGTLAVAYAARQPRKLHRLIVASDCASYPLFRQSIWALLKTLPSEDQEAIKDAVQHKDFAAPAYLGAVTKFMRTFVCRANPYPPPALAASRAREALDNTVRQTMLGQSPFLCNGSLADWSSIPLLPRIQVPTLIYNGEFDTAQDQYVMPFFKLIPRVRWITFPNASHIAHLDSVEVLEKVLDVVGNFLRSDGNLHNTEAKVIENMKPREL